MPVRPPSSQSMQSVPSRPTSAASMTSSQHQQPTTISHAQLQAVVSSMIRPNKPSPLRNLQAANALTSANSSPMGTPGTAQSVLSSRRPSGLRVHIPPSAGGNDTAQDTFHPTHDVNQKGKERRLSEVQPLDPSELIAAMQNAPHPGEDAF